MAKRQRTLAGLALNAFGNVYHGRRIVVTGHSGFKGSWLTLWLTELGAEVTGISLKPDTNPSHSTALALSGVRESFIDIRSGMALVEAVQEAQPDIIFHLAAQPLVRRSYRDPIETYSTNVIGLVNLLESARVTPSIKVIVNATTDKVYAEQELGRGYRESDPLGGHDPYSTSKACAELVSESYRKSFFQSSGLRIATARAGNVVGGGDWAEDRIVPDIIRAIRSGGTLQIRNPKAVRPWQHVLEPLSGYLRLGQRMIATDGPEGAWNFGPHADANLPVAGLVEAFHRCWPDFRTVLATGAEPHEAALLKLDSSRAMELLDWSPVWNAAETIRRTAAWYQLFYATGELHSLADLNDYVATAAQQGLAWAL